MTKLNRQHGIEVGSKVRVMDENGNGYFKGMAGKIFTVVEVEVNPYDYNAEYHLEDYISVGTPDTGPQMMIAGRFELVSSDNGVDARGQPTVMDYDSLQPWQRVVTEAGYKGIVVVNAAGAKGIRLQSDGWVEAYFEEADVDYAPYNIVAVHEPAPFWQALDFEARTGLVWKKADVAKLEAVKAANEAVALAEAELEAAEAKLEAASAARAAL